MSPRTITLSILALLVLLGGSYGAYLIFKPTIAPVATEEEGTGTPFPIIGGRAISGNREVVPNTGSDAGTGEDGGIGQLGGEPQATIVDGTLTRISSTPVAGALALTRGSTTVVRYIEQSTGHLYELPEGERTPRKLSNTTIPKIQEVLWGEDGNSAILRSYSDKFNKIQTLIATLATSSSPAGTTQLGELRGTVLAGNLADIALSPDRKNIFYLTKVGDGVVGIVADFQNKKQTQLFDSMLSEWRAVWVGNDSVALFPKPSSKIPGGITLINTKTKTTENLLSNIRGITTLGNSAKTTLLYGESTDTGFLTRIFSVKQKETDFFPLQTIPEKCTWSKNDPALIYCAVPARIPGGSYPDDWYKGKIIFSDIVWRINTDTGASDVVFDSTANIVTGALDIIDPQLDPQERSIYFKDKGTGILWGVKLP